MHGIVIRIGKLPVLPFRALHPRHVLGFGGGIILGVICGKVHTRSVGAIADAFIECSAQGDGVV